MYTGIINHKLFYMYMYITYVNVHVHVHQKKTSQQQKYFMYCNTNTGYFSNNFLQKLKVQSTTLLTA